MLRNLNKIKSNKINNGINPIYYPIGFFTSALLIMALFPPNEDDFDPFENGRK